MIGRAAPQVWRLHGLQPTGHTICPSKSISSRKGAFSHKIYPLRLLNYYLLNVLYSKQASQLWSNAMHMLAELELILQCVIQTMNFISGA